MALAAQAIKKKEVMKKEYSEKSKKYSIIISKDEL